MNRRGFLKSLPMLVGAGTLAQMFPDIWKRVPEDSCIYGRSPVRTATEEMLEYKKALEDAFLFGSGTVLASPSTAGMMKYIDTRRA